MTQTQTRPLTNAGSSFIIFIFTDVFLNVRQCFFPLENSTTRIQKHITSARFPPSQSRTEINSPRGSSRGAGATRAAPVLLRDEAPALRHPSRHKYLCCASLRLRPGHLMLHLIRTSGGSSWDVLLMDYRFSLLPRRFTMHPVCSHQIFSALWLELMRRSPPAESSLLISERKLGIGLKKNKTALLIKAGNLLASHWICL